MKNIIKTTLLLLLFTTSSCQRQELEEPIQITALIPVTIDWSESNVATEETKAVSIYFFPKDGGEPTIFVSNDIYRTEAVLLVGKYSVLIFNETVYESSWTGISFEGTDKYNTFAAVARKNSTGKGNLLYTGGGDSENIICNPEPLAAWSFDEFEVTQDMITHTRSKTKQSSKSLSDAQTKAIDKSLEVFTGIKPQPRTAKLSTTIKIRNLNNAHTLTAAIKGMATGIFLASGLKISPESTQLFTFDPNLHVWADEQQIHGSTVHSLTTFGQLPNENAVYNFRLDAVLQWGESPQPWKWDVTDQINQSKDLELILNLGIKEHKGDFEIDLGKLKDGVDIGDWNNENIEIQ